MIAKFKELLAGLIEGIQDAKRYKASRIGRW